MLLAIMIVAVTSIAIGVSVATVTSLRATESIINKDALLGKTLAESCLEDNLMKMSRGDFAPTSFTTTEGSCTIEISGNSPYVLNAIGTVGRTVRKIRATVTIDNEVLNIESWKEEY